jgi:hypothetical protein
MTALSQPEDRLDTSNPIIRSVSSKNRGEVPRLGSLIENAWMSARRVYKADQAACLCIAPDDAPAPRIAFTERSIAAHNRLIS